jgi:Tol biopolymer transport system component
LLCVILGAVFSLGIFSLNGRASQLVTHAGSSFTPPAGAGGNSGMPIVSADGRYVVFASTADNLASTGTNAASLTRAAGNLNVYVRDRTNQTTTLVSINAPVAGISNVDYVPRGISTNGQYVLFESIGSLVAFPAGASNNTAAVFVRDVVHATTTLVSVGTNGFAANGMSSNSVMTPDGRYVAFASSASNLVPGDTNQIADIFVRDLADGTTTLASVGAVLTNAIGFPASLSDSPAITPDGRYVAFYSTATNLVSGAGINGEIFVRDLVGGTTTWASTGSRGSWFRTFDFPYIASCNFEISDDGKYVAYEAFDDYTIGTAVILRYGMQTGLTDLISSNAIVPQIAFQSVHSLDMTPDGRFIIVPSTPSNMTLSPIEAMTNITLYLWDAQSASNTLVGANTNGLPSPGTICASPTISTNGQFVAFLSNAADLTTNPISSDFHLYLRDVVNGTTALMDVNSNGFGAGVNPTTVPVMSADGSITVFDSRNILLENRRKFSEVFAYNRLTGANELISGRNPILPSLAPDGISGLGANSVSSNGQFVAFYSDADNVVSGDTNSFRDVFVRNLILGTNILASVATNGASGDGISTDPAISGDGRYVAFTSAADNLVANDTNGTLDVFVRDLQAQTTTLVSIGSNGVDPGNGDSYSPAISANGRYVLFFSKASNLVPGLSASVNIYFRDLQIGTTYALTSGSGGNVAVMTPDGSRVAFYGFPPGGLGAALYVWSSQSNALSCTNASGLAPGLIPLQVLAISANGSKLAYLASSPVGLYVADLVSNTVSPVVSSVSFTSHATFQFSADGHYLAYSYTPSGLLGFAGANVYLYDCQAGTSFQINQSFQTLRGASASSDSPAISPDGRYIAYHSLSGIIFPNDINTAENMVIYDRANNESILASVDLSGNATANDNALKPVFSADSQTLAFESWASDLDTGDFNANADIFALNLVALPVTIAGGGGGGSSNSPPLFAELIPAGTISSNLAVMWPLASGASYQVQFKTNLNDAAWQVVPGTPAFIGDTGYIDDPAPTGNQKYYRIVLTSP